MTRTDSGTKRSALRFVIFIGIISLFADFTYEGARSINGQFLQTLGASAAVVGFTAGFGELVGYALRFVFGVIADRTRRYWLNSIIGYTINLFAVPALALAGNWPMAAALIIAERVGRAVRKPSVEAMLSYAGSQTGQGWAFGLHEALDQLGATLGPLAMSLVLFLHGTYRNGYAIFLISATFSMVTLLLARHYYPHPHKLDQTAVSPDKDIDRAYWGYLAAAACIAAGFADFALIGFHLQKTAVVSPGIIPIYYAVAMGVGAIGSLLLGRLFDRFAMPTMLLSFLLSAFFAPLVFLGHGGAAILAGMFLWGLGMAAQETLIKPLIAGIVAARRRATAFGMFDTGYGAAWFLGSWLMGVLYAKSLHGLVIFSVLAQLAALPIFAITHHKASKRRTT